VTAKRRRPTERDRAARQSVDQARRAVREVEATDPGDVVIDPASGLFFEFAAPLLLTARDEAEFQTAAMLAEFVWTATFYDAASQAELLEEFIAGSGVDDAMIPWLLEVYDELAARKQALVG